MSKKNKPTNYEMQVCFHCNETELAQLKDAVKAAMQRPIYNGQALLGQYTKEFDKDRKHRELMWKNVASSNRKFMEMLTGSRHKKKRPRDFEAQLRRIKSKIVTDHNEHARKQDSQLPRERPGPPIHDDHLLATSDGDSDDSGASFVPARKRVLREKPRLPADAYKDASSDDDNKVETRPPERFPRGGLQSGNAGSSTDNAIDVDQVVVQPKETGRLPSPATAAHAIPMQNETVNGDTINIGNGMPLGHSLNAIPRSRASSAGFGVEQPAQPSTPLPAPMAVARNVASPTAQGAAPGCQSAQEAIQHAGPQSAAAPAPEAATPGRHTVGEVVAHMVPRMVKPHLDSLRNRNNAMAARIQILEQDKVTMTAQITDFGREKDDMARQLTAAQQEKHATDIRLTAVQQANDALANRVATMRQDMAVQYADLQNQIALQNVVTRNYIDAVTGNRRRG